MEFNYGSPDLLMKNISFIGKSRATIYRVKNKENAHSTYAANLPTVKNHFEMNLSFGEEIEAINGPENVEENENNLERRSQENININKRQQLENCCVILDEMLNRQCRNKSSPLASLTPFDVRRYQSVHMYIGAILDGKPKIKAAEDIAITLWKNYKSYIPRAIPNWTKTFIRDGKLPEFRQGQHSKRKSLLADEDIREKACAWLRSIKPKDRSPQSLQDKLEKEILLETLGERGSLSLATVKHHMNLWGFQWRKSGQQIYFDGHERADVVEYRKAWAKRMVNYRKSMVEYEGEEMDEKIAPRLREREKKIVWVTHDECTFYSNDGRENFWLEANESIIKKKGQGASIMVSDFLCPCHGPLRLPKEKAESLGLPENARCIILPGINRQGFWKSEDMVKQLRNKAIPIFKALHPNSVALFTFDQSTNHNAYHRDALVVNRMTLNSKEEKEYNFKDGWYLHGTERIEQSMYEMRNDKKWFKGIKQVSNTSKAPSFNCSFS